MRRPTTFAVGVTAQLPALIWQYLTVRFNYYLNWTALFHTGESANLPLIQGGPPVYRFTGSAGCDAMYYRLIAHDPLEKKGL